MTEKQENVVDSEQWPSVDVAYGFVLPSYQMLASRFEAADARLTSLMNIASSLTLAAPLLGKALRPEISFTSGWFISGISIFATIAALGLIGRITGLLTLPDPMVHYNESLHEPEWTFKKNAIYFAGQHFAANGRAVDRKGKVSIAMTLFLMLEIVLFAVWIGGQPT